jgi:RHS repeat-associated protein
MRGVLGGVLGLVLYALALLPGAGRAEAATGSSQIFTATLSDVTFKDVTTGNIASMSGTMTIDGSSGDLLSAALTLNLPWLSSSCLQDVGSNDATRTEFIIDSGVACVHQPPYGVNGVRVYLLTFAPLTSPGSQAIKAADYVGNFGLGGNLISGSIIVTPAAIVKNLGEACDVPGSLDCGDPITVGTGNLFEQVTDYETSGQNRMAFTRYYNSMNNPTAFASALGQNWRSNYDSYVDASSASMVSVERADGQMLDFTLSGGKWVTDSDVDLGLTRSGSSWTLTDADDTVETYTSDSTTSVSRLTSIRARDGYTQTLKYNSNDQLASVTDSYNRTLDFTYAGNGLLATVKTPDGLVLSYAYTASGLSGTAEDRLSSVAYSTSPQTSQTYLHEDSGLPLSLTGIIDENGNRYATWTYDSSGRATSSQHAGGADLTRVAYDDTDGSRTVTNALGQQQIYKFATLQGIPKVTEIDRLASPTTQAARRLFAYDSNGYLAAATDWNGNETAYVNDARGLPVSITEAAGTAEQRTTAVAWLSTFHLPAKIAAPGLTTTFAYDASGDLLTRAETDATSNTAPYSTKGQTRTWHFTWADFLPASATDPRGAATRFQWDGSGALVAITNALGQVTRITSHLPGGLPQTIADPNRVATTLAYDVRDRLQSSMVATGAGPLTTRFGYDGVGNLIRITLPDASALANAYDAAHRLVAIADLLGNHVGYALDPLGDQTAASLSAGSRLADRHSAGFDALGRLRKDIGGVGQTTSYAYDANGDATATTDPLGRVTRQAFDALDRLVRVADPAGGVATIGYDPQDQPVTVTDPNGNATYYVYDGFGDLIEIRSPDTGDTVFYYDADGNLVKRAGLGIGDKTDIVTDWAYDALDRVTARSHPGDAAENVAYVYDQSGAGFGIGQLTKVTDSAGTLTRSYDERGNVLKETRTLGAAILTTTYAYDAASRIASITYPSGWAALYTRDAMGRVTAVAAKPPHGAAVPVARSIAYQPFGPVAGLVLGNGITETRAYDLDYRLTALSDAGNKAVRTAKYAYNAADDVLSVADNVFGTQKFTYDALDRLSGASGFYGSPLYSYDPVGNLLRIANGTAITSLVYAADSNRLTEVESGSALVREFAYSPEGNIASDQQSLRQIALAYNEDSRLASVKNQPKSGGAASYDYFYDAFGQRLQKKQLGNPGVETAYQYDLAGHLTEQRELLGGTSRTDYIYLGDRPIGMITPGGAVAYYETGLLDTPQQLTGSGQGAIWSADYQPFGQTRTLVAGTAQNLRLPGQYADAETGYYQNGFRDYDPSLGRYLESDPIGLDGGLNTYAYADGNPITGADPSGLRLLLNGQPIDGPVQGYISNSDDEFSASCPADAQAVDAASNLAGGVTFAAGLIPIVVAELGTEGGQTPLVPAELEGDAAAAAGTRQAAVGAFKTFATLKKYLGSPGFRSEVHHVVEQNQANIDRFGAQAIQNIRNVVPVSIKLHRAISRFYSTNKYLSGAKTGETLTFTGGQTFRQWVRSQSFERQYDIGSKVLKYLYQKLNYQ